MISVLLEGNDREGNDRQVNNKNNKNNNEISNTTTNNKSHDSQITEYDINTFFILDNLIDIKIRTNSSIHTFLFDTKKYLNDILESYSFKPENILNQVLVDFCRTNVYSNNKKIDTVNDFILIYTKFNNLLCKINNNKYDLLMILLTLCCQSSYGLHYLSLRNIYCEDNDNLLLCSSNKNRKSCFAIVQDVFTVSIETNLIIKDIKNNKNIKNINTKIIIDLYLNDNQLVEFNDYGLFYWNIY